MLGQKPLMKPLFLLALAGALGLAGCATAHPSSSSGREQSAARPLKLVSWNLEFLAEKDGSGCEPRVESDYAAMRRIVESLDADVIAFQEVETTAAAARVFDPTRYTILMEARQGSPGGTCGGRYPQQTVIRQAVGFAIRKGIAFERHADVTSILRGNEQLRSGVDVTLMPGSRTALRLLSIHLKSGCFTGQDAKACPVLLDQIPALEAWIDDAARGPEPFVILGDWNRRLGLRDDQVWTEIDDANPTNADLRLADAGTPPKCDPRYDSFIDHVVLDRRADAKMIAFSETLYAPGEKHYSDHCPVAVTLGK